MLETINDRIANLLVDLALVAGDPGFRASMVVLSTPISPIPAEKLVEK